MKSVEFVYRQGDVHIFRVDSFPKGDRFENELTKNKQVALGELTGHHHWAPEADVFKIKGLDALTFLDVKKPSKLVHGLDSNFKGTTPDEEYHNEILLREGKYVTGIVEETDWLTRTIRKVID